MTAIEFLKSKDPNFSLLTDTNQSHSLQGWVNLMEEYAQQQVKKCDLADVGESPRPSTLLNRTRIGLGYMDRLRVLFGKEIRVDVEIELDKETTVLKTSAKTIVQPIFKPKPSKYDLVAKTPD